MSLDIKAIYIRKELLKWLENEEIRFDVVTDDECKDLDNRISSAEKTWGEGFSYEAGAITVDAAVSAVMAALETLGIERIILWMGIAPRLLVIDIMVRDLRKILLYAADTESTLTLSTVDGCGIATVVMPTMEDDFLVSSAGCLKPLLEDVQRRCPGGVMFRRK